MINDRPLIAVALGPQLRAWELDCIRNLRNAHGPRLIGCQIQEHSAEPTSWFEQPFQRFQQQGPGAYVNASAAQAEFGFVRLPHLNDADIVLLLGGADVPNGHVGRVWCFRHPDDSSTARFLPGVREALNDERLAVFELIERGNGIVLGRCVVAIDGMEPMTLATEMLRVAAAWPPAAMGTAIEANGFGPSEQLVPARTPGRIRMLIRGLKRRLMEARPAARYTSGPYNIGILHQPIHVLLEEEGSRNVRWLPTPSKGKSRLEPFGYIGHDGELNALFRKCDEDGTEGVIARVRPKPDNILKRSRVMLDEGDDSGYPFTLEVDGVVHVVISSMRDRTIRLDRVNTANDGFETGPCLIREALHAPTLFRHEGRWWLMGTSDPLPNALLRAWHAESIEGPYIEHGHGPLKCDVRSSRPAGTPFVHNGELYRPALDGSRPEKPAVVINRIVHLDTERFHEEVVQRITGFNASAYGAGVRTISAMGGITLVDGLRSAVVSGKKANASSSKRRKQSDT